MIFWNALNTYLYLTEKETVRSSFASYASIPDRFELFSSKIQRDLDLIRSYTRDIAAETHHWLALQALNLDVSEVRLNRFVPLRVYLSKDMPDAINRVSAAIEGVMVEFGFQISDDFPPVRSSWSKKWFTKSVEALSHPELEERLNKIERALEIKHLDAPHADITCKQAECIKTLIEADKDFPEAAMQGWIDTASKGIRA